MKLRRIGGSIILALVIACAVGFILKHGEESFLTLFLEGVWTVYMAKLAWEIIWQKPKTRGQAERTNHGFTIIELMVIIVIIGAISAVAIAGPKAGKFQFRYHFTKSFVNGVVTTDGVSDKKTLNTPCDIDTTLFGEDQVCSAMERRY